MHEAHLGERNFHPHPRQPGPLRKRQMNPSESESANWRRVKQSTFISLDQSSSFVVR